MLTFKNKKEETTLHALIQLAGSCCHICKNKNQSCSQNIKVHNNSVEDCLFFEKMES